MCGADTQVETSPGLAARTVGVTQWGWIDNQGLSFALGGVLFSSESACADGWVTRHGSDRSTAGLNRQGDKEKSEKTLKTGAETSLRLLGSFVGQSVSVTSQICQL